MVRLPWVAVKCVGGWEISKINGKMVVAIGYCPPLPTTVHGSSLGWTDSRSDPWFRILTFSLEFPNVGKKRIILCKIVSENSRFRKLLLTSRVLLLQEISRPHFCQSHSKSDQIFWMGTDWPPSVHPKLGSKRLLWVFYLTEILGGKHFGTDVQFV